MNWTAMETYGEAPEDVFEDICCHLFDLFGQRSYQAGRARFMRYRGAGGDGGVEAIWRIDGEDYSAVQAKWFTASMGTTQWNQIRTSISTALRVHPDLKEYYVCIPRNLGAPKGDGKTCEEDRWEGLVSWAAGKYPDLSLQLWGDHQLTREMCSNGAEGALGLWFGGLTLPRDAFKHTLTIQQTSWMRGRYMGDLHMRGEIQNRLDEIAMPVAHRVELVSQLEALAESLKAVDERLDFFLMLESRLGDDIVALARELREVGRLASGEIGCLVDDLKFDGGSSPYGGVERYFRVAGSLVSRLGEIRYGQTCATSARKLATYIEGAILEEYGYAGLDLPRFAESHRLIALADAGAGKTHAFCAEALDLCGSDYALPILLRAVSFSPSKGWGPVLSEALGLREAPSDVMLLRALEASASLLDRRDGATGYAVRGKVVVMVDGIDESSERSRWLELIGEAEAISAEYRRIRFCFSSRPDAVWKIPDDSIRRDAFWVHRGDVPVESIMDDYFESFEIELDRESPVRRFLRSPLELKLFCSLYRGRDLGMGVGVPAGLVRLVGAQIDALEDEVCEKTGCARTVQPVHRVLAKASELLRSTGAVTRDDLAESAEMGALVNANVLDETLRIVTEYGALSCFEEKAGPFAPAVTLYESGVQTFFDYIVAHDFVESCGDCRSASMPDYLAGRYESLMLIAVMAFERYGFLMTENPSFEDCVTECSPILNFNCDVLASVSPSSAKSAVPMVKAWMSEGSRELLVVVNDLVCRVAKVEGHALGPDLLDGFLRAFPNPASRDLSWSLPEYLELRDGGKTRWHEGIVSGEHLALSAFDRAHGRPLVVAWHLSSLDSRRRELCESSLLCWAAESPDEFLMLFSQMIDVDDPQIVESMFGVAASLSSMPACPDRVLGELGSISCDRALRNDSAIDASVRHHARIIAERACRMGVATGYEIEDCRPPYVSSRDSIPLDAVGMDGETNGGPSPMSYDLSRYVVCEPVQTRFFSLRSGGSEKSRAERFLEYQAERLGVGEINVAQFCHCAVQGCIRRWGWSEESFSYLVPGDDEPEAFGVDVAVRRRCSPSTHGQRSRIVSVGEKYVWCSKNEIIGYLADRLPLSDGSSEGGLVNDYVKLDSFRTPFDFSSCDPGASTDRRFVIPQRFSIDRVDVGANCEKVALWVEADDALDVEVMMGPGLFIDGELPFERSFPLSAYYHVEMWGAERCVWASACAVPKGGIEALEAKLISDERFCREFFQVDSIRAYVESYCYITPQEVCSSAWLDERCSFKGDVSYDDESANSVIAYTSHIDCVSSVDSKGDVYITIPSGLFREMLGVVSCDGKRGFDEHGKCLFEYRCAGEIGDGVVRQALYVDADALSAGLEASGLELCWFARVLKREASDSHDHGFDGHFENDRLFLVRVNGSTSYVRLLLQDRFDPSSEGENAQAEQLSADETPEWLREIMAKYAKPLEEDGGLK